jgi:serine/threonine-protein kinase
MSTLSPEQWRVLSPYLDQVLALPEEERESWLHSFRSERPDLADALLQLLEDHRALSEDHFLEQRPPHPVFESSLTGHSVGAYKLLNPIGHGGMGDVWLAERSDGRFEKRVAVKLLRIGVASSGGAARFKREGRILAQLAHPNIAELLDAGVTSSGQPF